MYVHNIYAYVFREWNVLAHKVWQQYGFEHETVNNDSAPKELKKIKATQRNIYEKQETRTQANVKQANELTRV